MAHPDPFIVLLLGPPPPGIDLAESTQVRNYIITAVSLAVAALSIAARFLARFISGVKLQADDYVILIAFALTIATAAFSIISGVSGAGTHVWAATPETIQLGLKYGYIYAFVWGVSVSVTKVSIILFYQRTFLVQSWRFRAWLHFLFIITLGLALSIIVANVTLCQPLSYYWRQFEPGSQGRCNDAGLFLLITGVLNAVIDVTLLATPIPLILKLKMSSRKKTGVCGIILSGSVVCVASFVRIGYLASYWKSIDKTWIAGDVSAWSSIESSFGLISACLPLLRPLYTRYSARYSKGVSINAFPVGTSANRSSNTKHSSCFSTWGMKHGATKRNNAFWPVFEAPNSKDGEVLLTDVTTAKSVPAGDVDHGGIIVHSEVSQSYVYVRDW